MGLAITKPDSFDGALPVRLAVSEQTMGAKRLVASDPAPKMRL